MRVSLLPTLLIAPLVACTVGPDHERPTVVGMAGTWTAQPDVVSQQGNTIDMEPWRAMGDPLLTELVERAATANLDLAQAEARLREARAMRDAVVGRQLPEIGAKASAARQRVSENGQLPVANIPGFDREYSLFDAGFDASWEIDLWGGTRRAVEAAGKRAELAEAQRREVQLRVVAEVVRTYAELRGAQAREATLRTEAKAQSTIAALVRQRFKAGEAARFDDARAETQARAAQAALPSAQARIRAAANGLALLTAQPPEALLDRLLAPAPLPQPPALVTTGLRSDILQRRPDIAMAEAQLAAATADVGVQTANLFPRLSLVGSFSQQSRTTDTLFSSGSTGFGIGPALHWPLFSGGRIRAQIRAAGARKDGAAAAYEQAVLSALADSETALNRYAAALASARELSIARDSSATALSLAQQRYEAGEDDLIMFMDATSRFNNIARAADDANIAALQAHASLVKALGGGWKASQSDASADMLPE